MQRTGWMAATLAALPAIAPGQDASAAYRVTAQVKGCRRSGPGTRGTTGKAGGEEVLPAT